MENKEENNLEIFTRKLFKVTSTENIEFDFTDKVMAQLPKTTVSEEVFQYQPLITRRGWIISGTVVVLFLVLLVSLYDNNSLNELSSFNLDLSDWFDWVSKLFILFNYKVITISVLIFTGYFMLEVFVLNTWDRKNSL